MRFISILESELGIEAIKEYHDMQPGDVYSTYADIDSLTNDTNYKPNTSIDEGLKQFVAWYKNYYKVVEKSEKILA